MVAKATATLDALSQGRLIVGVGAGALAAEFKNIDAPWEDRGDYTDEALGVFKELWTSESSSFQGKYFNFSEVQCYPKPVQKPHPPLWVGGNSPRSLRRAAELGDVWHPTRPTVDMLGEMVPRLRRMAERAGRNPDEIGIAARQPMKIVASESQAPKGWPPLRHVGQRRRGRGAVRRRRRWPFRPGYFLQHSRAPWRDGGEYARDHGALRFHRDAPLSVAPNSSLFPEVQTWFRRSRTNYNSPSAVTECWICRGPWVSIVAS